MRIAVTGATGFLGSHLVDRLVADGHEVSALARDERKAASLGGKAGRVVTGDVGDRSCLLDLAEGADAFVHLVSNFRTAQDPTAVTHRTNHRGTVLALDAARAASVRRFVHCSTIGVHGNVRTTPANEDSPYNPGDDYQRSKVEAERACAREAERGGMEVVVVRPCSIYGPGDLRMLKMFRMLKKRRFFTLGRCRENFHAVYVDDLVDGFVRAMQTTGIAGETFIVGGPTYLTLDAYIATAARAVGAPPPAIRLPYAPVYAASVVCEGICKPLGIEPPLHPRRVKFFKNNRAFSIEKARRLLGYVPRVDLEEGMRRTVAWYHESGHL